MATKKPIIKKAVVKKPAIKKVIAKKPLVKKAVAKKPIVSKMKNGGKIKKAQAGITTSTSYDPETKETTIKKSWSNTRSGSLSNPGSAKSSPAPTRNTNSSSKPTPRVISKPTVSKTPMSATTKGERKIVSFPSPTPAKAVGMEPKAGVDVSKMAKPDTRFLNRMRIEAKRQTANAIQKEKEEALLEKNPGKSLKQIYNKQYRDEKQGYRQGQRQLHRENQRIYKRDSSGGGVQDKQRSGACRTC